MWSHCVAPDLPVILLIPVTIQQPISVTLQPVPLTVQRIYSSPFVIEPTPQPPPAKKARFLKTFKDLEKQREDDGSRIPPEVVYVRRLDEIASEEEKQDFWDERSG